MIATKFRSVALLFVFAYLFPAGGYACRYTVRDVGLVDIAPNPYHLYCYVRDDTPEKIISTFKNISYAALLDSNIQAEVIHVDQQKEHPAMRYFRFWEIHSFPSTILVSPEGQSMVVPILSTDKPFKETVWSALDRVLSSPCREAILRHIPRAYCVVLLVDGKDADENKKALRSVQSAIDHVSRIMSQMPTLIEEKPYLIRISPESFSQEQTLLWSLGLNKKDMSKPSVAVLYGRARRIGPVLKGEEITESRLSNILGLIGASCECGLDRKWMMGTLIPIRWGEETQSAVVKFAGFDAESPLVKTEIAQILSIRPAAQSADQASTDPVDNFLYGYQEQAVDLEPQPVAAVGLSVGQLDSSGQQADATEPVVRYHTVLFTMLGMGILILAGGLLILIRSRRRTF